MYILGKWKYLLSSRRQFHTPSFCLEYTSSVLQYTWVYFSLEYRLYSICLLESIHFWWCYWYAASPKKSWGFPSGSVGKESTCCVEDTGDEGSIPGLGRSPGGGQGNHSSILVWRIPWTEEPGGLQSIELQKVGHDWSDWAHIKKHAHIFPSSELHYTRLVSLLSFHHTVMDSS